MLNIHTLKKIILFFCFCISLSTQAQILRVGPKVGLQVSRSNFEDREFQRDYRRIPALAFHAGMVMNVKVSDIFSLQTEFLYQENRKHIESELAGDWLKECYQYLSLPALIRVTFPMGHNEIYVNAGPNISYWLGGRGEVMHSEVFDFELETLKYEMVFGEGNDDYQYVIYSPNRFQLGLDLGIGAVFPLGAQYLMVDLRFTAGHTNMVKDDVKYLPLSFYEDNLLHSQQVLSLSIAYIINLDFHELNTKGKSTSTQKER